MKTFYACVELDAEQIAEHLDSNQAEVLIKTVDLAQQDYEFTLNIVKHLLTSLRNEHESGMSGLNQFKQEIMEILNGQE